MSKLMCEIFFYSIIGGFATFVHTVFDVCAKMEKSARKRYFLMKLYDPHNQYIVHHYTIYYTLIMGILVKKQ